MGTFTLLKQDPDVTFFSLTPEVIKGIPQLSRLGFSLGKAFLHYLRPGFHPDQNDTNYLAVEILKTFENKQAAQT
jgi:predicted metal-dependent hydrolase